ncbi:MAG: uncharacterized protein A8A55_1339 [Amphiamblys sp. WSBS2006]|nr:MAG: uncharacterized protein A8A55_1339 [Amphiamblys sp. WSBS2006]
MKEYALRGFAVTVPGKAAFGDYFVFTCVMLEVVFLCAAFFFYFQTVWKGERRRSKKIGRVEESVMQNTGAVEWTCVLFLSSISWVFSEMFLSSRIAEVTHSSLTVGFYAKYLFSGLLGKGLFISLIGGQLLHVWMAGRSGVYTSVFAQMLSMYLFFVLYFAGAMYYRPVRGLFLLFDGIITKMLWNKYSWLYWESFLLVVVGAMFGVFSVMCKKIFPRFRNIEKTTRLGVVFFCVVAFGALSAVIEGTYFTFWTRHLYVFFVCVFTFYACVEHARRVLECFYSTALGNKKAGGETARWREHQRRTSVSESHVVDEEDILGEEEAAVKIEGPRHIAEKNRIANHYRFRNSPKYESEDVLLGETIEKFLSENGLGGVKRDEGERVALSVLKQKINAHRAAIEEERYMAE